MYAVLDIETTGGKYNEEGITEVAIYRFDGHEVTDQFISLVNPEKPIQEFVVKLTGINNKMLRNAPKFYEVAKRIIEITKDCTIIAHNASFDFRILNTEFKRLGFDYQKNTLCTVELSRKLIPDEDSYSLGKLCKSLGIPMSNRHRASGDAMATVQLFKLLLDKDSNKEIIQQSIKYFDNRNLKDKLNSILENIPEKMGVFYIHNSQGKVIYLGKGKNLKSEVTRLFLKESKRAQKIQERVHNVTYEFTGNELFNRLRYNIELDTLQPKFNFSKKRKNTKENFAHSDFILQHKGRELEENAIILVENNEVVGYGFTNLSFQESHLDILRSILTPTENKQLAKSIVKNYLKNNSVPRIIRF
ncbi:exonuclease domain-containing protein [Pseudotenacibaculum sp. MALMAid0570]|uniref:exonuclease domain-containing protein n=1 Tax=Pseudotenacibaculum sp. MALMAid0570 TaxID=3143938 RepID=UPI0032DE383F